MSTKGRKPKADHLNLVHGAGGVAALPEKDEARPDDVKAAGPARSNQEAVLGKRPAVLKSTPAKNEYDRIVRGLLRLSKWDPLFTTSIAIYAQAYADWIEAERHLKEDGKVILSPKNYPIQSPWLAIRNRAQEMMAKMGSEFGLTLISQVRVQNAQMDLFGLTPAPTKDDGDDNAFSNLGR